MRLLISTLLLSLALPAAAQAKCKEFKKLAKADYDTVVEALGARDEDCRSDAAKALGDAVGDKRFSTDQARESLPTLEMLMIADDDYGVRRDGLRAIEEYMNNANLRSTALETIQATFEQDEQDSGFFIKALAILMKQDSARARSGVVVHLSRYRRHKPAFVMALLGAVQDLNQPEARDLALVVAMDAGQPRNVRLAALTTLEKLSHPGLADAYLALLGDSDKKVQIRCVDGLSRAGLPPAKVQSALSGVVRNESKGDVRAKALKGLKRYVSPELLPLLNSQITSEKHVMAWYHSLEMLLSVADDTSFGALNQLLVRDWSFRDDLVIEVFHTLARIAIAAPDDRFGPMADQAIASIAARIDKPEDNVGAVGPEARAAGRDIIALLSPRQPAQVIHVVQGWGLPTYDEVVIVDMSSYDESAFSYEMSVEVGDNGDILSAGGTAFGFEASVRVSE
ncbi:MAG: HEAT repeat domain-containing protein [Deltaproteobacteria bacterium]|nr:HEAT repeat domain-containing protein [Deltaproteobacteria bacterium]